MIPMHKRVKIKDEIKKWVKRNFKRLKEIELSDLRPNPFLLRALGIREDTVKAYEFSIRERIERGLVTSFGSSLLPNILSILGFKKANIEDIDHVFTKGGTNYYIQLKSGPEGFTRPALRKTKQTFDKIKESDPMCKAVIAMAYGDEKLLSPVWGDEAKESADLLLIGKNFWNFFFGEGTYEELLSIFEEAGKEAMLEEIGKEKSLYTVLVETLMQKVVKSLKFKES